MAAILRLCRTLAFQASPTGFEPVISTLTGWRALQAAPRGRVVFDLTARNRIPTLMPAASNRFTDALVVTGVVMYEVDDLDQVIALEGIPPSDMVAPLPVVLADDNVVVLGYLTSSPAPNWDGRNPVPVSPQSSNQSVAILKFDAFAHMFGPPNDEAIQGHPLHDRGLGYYGAYEVVDSSWIRKMERMNSVHDRHDPASFFKGKRHFIFTFHDSTFECVARFFTIEQVTGTLGCALDRMCEILGDTWRR